MLYKEAITEAMTMLGKDPRTIFLGQSVLYPGHVMFNTLSGVPDEKKIEMPVAEDMQMGISIGLALEGYIPISIYPRIDFLMCAMNQLVLHLDKIKVMSHGEFKPKVIIRTMIGSKSPLNPGPQHCKDYTRGIETLLSNNTWLIKVDRPFIDYKDALEVWCPTILVEGADLYETIID